MAFVLDVNLRIAEILNLQKIEASLAKVQGTIGVTAAGVGAAGKTSAGSVSSVTAATKAHTAALTANAVATDKATVSTNKFVTTQKKVGPGLKKVATETKKAGQAADTFGQKMKLAGVRYAAFVAATAVPLAIIASVGKATAAVIEFDTAILKLRQITGQTNEQIGGMRDTILDLATSTGTSASEIARVSKVLAQAGQRGDVLTESLTALSKVPLTPSFETIDAAVEGSIAALNQFNNEGLTTTEVLDTLTALSNNFAASSEDIAKGISRGGAAFEAIGGTFKEFASIFTTVRQATRESAETVGTFMKTISSRLADPKIVNFLEGKGIRIAESIEAGNPVGAIKEIAAALQNITSIQERVEIGTKLAGRRQISRLNALVSNIQILDETLATAGTSAGAFGEIAEVGLAGLQAQLNILGQEFNKLVQTLAEPVFIPIIRGVTTAGKAFVSMLEFIKPVIPALTTIIGLAAGFKLLAVSITAAGKALTFLSAAGIGGGIPGVLSSLSGVAGGGQAANLARERIQRRLGGLPAPVGGA
ncbi:MAG: phage tail tape measure protein, partial [Candidatus Kariarchaeaceae archaeon]